MEFLEAIADWIATRESLLSGTVAIVALLGLIVSAVGIIRREFRGRDAERTGLPGSAPSAPVPAAPERRAPEPAAPEPATPEQQQKISLQDLSAPAPFPIRFAESDGLHIAYAVLGGEAPDIVVSPGIISHLHLMSHLPPTRNTLDTFCGLGRVVCFDKRGQGLSDPSLSVPELDARARDIAAVMDAAGISRAILFGLSEGGPMCIKFAHDFPERVRALILLGTTACWEQSEDFPIGIPARTLDSLAAAWGTGVLRDVFFPSISRAVLDDETYRAFEKLIATRSSVRQLVEYMKHTDVRPLLPAIRCPTLVIHFGGDLAVPSRMGRALAESIPGAEFLEVSGVDHADLAQSREGCERVATFIGSLD